MRMLMSVKVDIAGGMAVVDGVSSNDIVRSHCYSIVYECVFCRGCLRDG